MSWLNYIYYLIMTCPFLNYIHFESLILTSLILAASLDGMAKFMFTDTIRSTSLSSKNKKLYPKVSIIVLLVQFQFLSLFFQLSVNQWICTSLIIGNVCCRILKIVTNNYPRFESFFFLFCPFFVLLKQNAAPGVMTNWNKKEVRFSMQE